MGNFKKFLLNEEYKNCTIQTTNLLPTLIDDIRNIQSTVPKECLYNGEDELGWIENGIQKLLHITILYGLNFEQNQEKIKTIYKEKFPNGFNISTKGIIYFKNKEKGIKIAVIKCVSKELEEFHKILKSDIDNNHNKDFEYIPHITLAYLKNNCRFKLPNLKNDYSWNCNSIEISRKDGSTFTLI